MSTAYHIVNYRKFEAQSTSLKGKTLEALCRAALDSKDDQGVILWSRVQDRVMPVQSEDGRQVVLNRVADLKSAIFGEMCLVQSNRLQSLLQLRASEASLSAITVAQIFGLQDSEAPKGSQFIRGMAYWLAVNNNLFFVKTNAMSALLINVYFDWLFRAAGSALPEGAKFQLQAEFDRAQFAGDIGEVRSLRISGKSTPQLAVRPVLAEDAPDKKTTRKVADRFFQFDRAVPVVEAILGREKATSLVDSLGPREYLAVDASVKVKGSRTAESRAKFKEVTNEIADTTDGTVRVEGKDGKLSEGDAILRTNMPFSLEHEGGNLLEFHNVADQLQVVYSRFVHDGKISA